MKAVRIHINVIDAEGGDQCLAHTTILASMDYDEERWMKIHGRIACQKATQQITEQVVNYFDHHTGPCDDA